MMKQCKRNDNGCTKCYDGWIHHKTSPNLYGGPHNRLHIMQCDCSKKDNVLVKDTFALASKSVVAALAVRSKGKYLWGGDYIVQSIQYSFNPHYKAAYDYVDGGIRDLPVTN